MHIALLFASRGSPSEIFFFAARMLLLLTSCDLVATDPAYAPLVFRVSFGDLKDSAVGVIQSHADSHGIVVSLCATVFAIGVKPRWG